MTTPTEIEMLVARLLDWDEYDEGKNNDTREDATTALTTLQAHLAAAVARAEAAEGALIRAWDRGRNDAATECNLRGIAEQGGYGLNRATQNYYRARDAIRALTPPADLTHGEGG